MRDTSNSCSISVKDESVTQKSMRRLVLPLPTPKVMSLQSPQWREVGLSLSWPVVSYWPHWCDQYLHPWNTNVDSLKPLGPLHWTFYPWSNKDTTENVQRIAQSFLFTQPRGTSTVSCWTGGGQFTLCGTSLVWLLLGEKVGFSEGLMRVSSAGSL